jgi:mannose-6-phosphate isomerase-like protein (cupin superfamily)
MNIRRIVTGHDRAGKSVLVSDGPAPRAVEFKHVPGLGAALLWDAAPGARVGGAVSDRTTSATWVPAAGGSNAMVVTFPPDAVMGAPGFDPMAAGGEYMQNLPGLAEKFEMDAPGMHTTDTIDYAVVLEGEAHLELDDGRVVKLQKHDVVVQNGTRHAWRNRSDKPVTIFFVLTGAARKAD